MELGEVLLTEEQIKGRVRELAQEISRDYQGMNPVLVGILKGGFVFLADLARNLTIPVQFDFIAVSSYGLATASSGVVRILKDLDTDVSGRHVLLVEDIVDTGLTLNYLVKNIKARKPASVEVCALLLKVSQQKVPVQVKYQGFWIPPVFVVGYGLDAGEQFRQLPYVAALKGQAE